MVLIVLVVLSAKIGLTGLGTEVLFTIVSDGRGEDKVSGGMRIEFCR